MGKINQEREIKTKVKRSFCRIYMCDLRMTEYA
jgi:hypothetical protein